MSKQKKPKIELPSVHEVAEYGGKAGPPQEAAPPAEQQAAQAEAPPEAPPETEDWHDKYLRAMAEMQNVQRRLSGERAEAVRFAIVDFARDLLGTLDDFERSFQAAGSAKSPQSVIDGMRIVYENLLKVLRAHQVTPIEAVGKPFDPAEHQAITQQPSDEHQSPTVLQEIQRGYKLQERVIRPAQVIISAPPQPTKADESEEEAPPADESDTTSSAEGQQGSL